MLRTPISKWIRAALPLILVFVISGCGTTTRESTFNQEFHTRHGGHDCCR